MLGIKLPYSGSIFFPNGQEGGLQKGMGMQSNHQVSIFQKHLLYSSFTPFSRSSRVETTFFVSPFQLGFVPLLQSLPSFVYPLLHNFSTSFLALFSSMSFDIQFPDVFFGLPTALFQMARERVS